jgi:hypothetical protein
MIDEKVKTDLPRPVVGGEWHNVYFIDVEQADPRRTRCGWIPLADGRWMREEKHASQEIAETHREDDPLSNNFCLCYMMLASIMDTNAFIWDEAINVAT